MRRILSIDVLRGLTMFFMIWVNDFWTLNTIPKWLKHASSGEDYLGFSDLIFPWFLFVMGMSIPFAFDNRFNKGETSFNVWRHIIFRSIALLIMGLFHMNMEMYNHTTSLISKSFFTILCTAAFFMIWNIYPKNKIINSLIQKILQITGMVILLIMILIYKGKNYSGEPLGFSTHWWGILGLIGWSYAIVASIYFIIRGSFAGIVIAFFICLGINIMNSSGISYNLFSWQNKDWIPGSGGLQALTFGGIITSLIVMKFKSIDNIRYLYGLILSMGVLSFIGGLFFHKFFIISKISNTPTWILFSLSSALFLYVLVHWIVDVKQWRSWYKIIQIAGTGTLTCYLIPYFYYSFRTILNIQLPIFFTTGIIGLLKSIIYTFLIISITKVLSRMGIRLKI